jgi:hypothetical protein
MLDLVLDLRGHCNLEPFIGIVRICQVGKLLRSKRTIFPNPEPRSATGLALPNRGCALFGAATSRSMVDAETLILRLPL